MAEDKPLTPEKQLLNIIEKPMSHSSLRAAAIKYRSLSLFSLSAIKARLAFLKNRFDMAGGFKYHFENLRIYPRFLFRVQPNHFSKPSQKRF
jgi:hypothetical protein